MQIICSVNKRVLQWTLCAPVIQCCMNSTRSPLLLISTSVIQSNQIRNQLSALFCRSTGDSHKASLLIYIPSNAGSSEYKVDIYTLHHGFLSNTVSHAFQFPPRMRTVYFWCHNFIHVMKFLCFLFLHQFITHLYDSSSTICMIILDCPFILKKHLESSEIQTFMSSVGVKAAHLVPAHIKSPFSCQ